ncbi:MAG: ATP-binding protein [Anaerolineae bacterium]|nr:ATP-binding protein [Anaerolineae bacterium]
MKKFTVKPRLLTRNEIIVGDPDGCAAAWLYLGRLAETGQLTDVRFDAAHPHVIAIFGKRGSGKSYTMGSMLESLCTRRTESSISHIGRDRAVLLFDTLGIFQWTDISLTEAADRPVIREQRAVWRGWNLQPEPLDVQVWIPQGTRSETTPASHREFAVRTADFTAADWGYLLDLDIYQDRMGQLLNDAYLKVTLEGWQGEGGKRGPKPIYSLDDLITCVKLDAEIQSSYRAETRRAVLQQLTTFRRNPLFQDEGTPLRDILTPGRMNVLVMNRMSGPLRLVVLSALIRRLLDARTEASEAEKHLAIRPDLSPEERAYIEARLTEAIPPAWVALDEAQNVLPSERRTAAGEMLVRFVREGRNYGLSFMVATQQPTALDSRLLAQVDTLIAHKLTVQGDIDYVRCNLKSSLPREVRHANRVLALDDLLRSLDVGQALVSNTEAERAIIVDIRPRVSVHGGF